MIEKLKNKTAKGLVTPCIGTVNINSNRNKTENVCGIRTGE